jgi:hypothetical protein
LVPLPSQVALSDARESSLIRDFVPSLIAVRKRH